MSTIVKDCIYRFIEISPLCKRFLDTHRFQRLRDIKQLGFAHLVYPSAVHTRLEHSLGVMHLSGELIDVLSKSGVSISEREKSLVQLAGLMHDSGHIAFSHLFDYILKEKGYDDDHEQRSVKLLTSINEEVKELTPHELQMVSKMIMGDTSSETRPFLFEIVHNKICGLDVDRFDYLQRDAYHTGIPGFQPDYLIKCARVQDGHLVFLQKAKAEIQFLYEARSRMFKLVYRHKAVMRIERVIRQIIDEIGLFDDWEHKNWEEMDDIEVMWQMRKSQLYNQIYSREWNKTPIFDPHKHCTVLKSKEIEDELKKVIFV